MRLACRADNLMEAQLLLDLLTTAGIAARVFNQNGQSAAGEIPPAVAGPQLWVDEDDQLERAKEVIDAFRRRPAPGSRRCAHCGEENPSNFLSCWACSRDFYPIGS